MRGILFAAGRRVQRHLPERLVVRVVAGPAKGARWSAGSGGARCFLGMYERPQLERFCSYIVEDAVVWDVGAHVGEYSVPSAMRASRGLVLAIEALPRNARLLRRNRDLNRLENMQILGLALGDQDGEATFSEGIDHYQGRVSGGSGISVPMSTADALLARYPAPSIMKIDVEGGEVAVLLGAQRILREARPIIFLSTHGASIKDECLAMLHSTGYDVEPLDAPDLDAAAEVLCQPGPARVPRQA